MFAKAGAKPDDISNKPPSRKCLKHLSQCVVIFYIRLHVHIPCQEKSAHQLILRRTLAEAPANRCRRSQDSRDAEKAKTLFVIFCCCHSGR
jgi:hypothetical protein